MLARRFEVIDLNLTQLVVLIRNLLLKLQHVLLHPTYLLVQLLLLRPLGSQL